MTSIRSGLLKVAWPLQADYIFPGTALAVQQSFASELLGFGSDHQSVYAELLLKAKSVRGQIADVKKQTPAGNHLITFQSALELQCRPHRQKTCLRMWSRAWLMQMPPGILDHLTPQLNGLEPIYRQ